MVSFSGLSVSIDANTADFQAGVEASEERLENFRNAAVEMDAALSAFEDEVEDVRDESLQLAAALTVLQERADEAEDEIDGAGRSAASTSGLFSALAVSTEGVSFSFGALSTVTVASLIPALLTLSTLIAPLTAGFVTLGAAAGGLAAAFGAVVGTGLLAFGQQRAEQNKRRLEQVNEQIALLEQLKDMQGELSASDQQRLEQLKERQQTLEDATSATGALALVMADLKKQIVDILVPFGRQFIPLVQDALEALPTLVENIIDSLGPMDEFRSFLRRLGEIGMRAIPALVGALVDVGRLALPALEQLISFLLERGPGAFQAMQRSVTELKPEIMALAGALVEAAPTLLEFGTVTAEVVLPALTALVVAMDGFMETVLQLPPVAQQATVGLLAFAPVLLTIAGIASKLTGLFSALGTGISVLGGVLTGTIGGAAALGAALGGLGVLILDVVGALDLIRSAGRQVGQLFGPELTSVFLTLGTVLSGGLLPIISAVGAAITRLVHGDVQGAIKAFTRVIGTFQSAIRNTLSLLRELIAKAAEATQAMPNLPGGPMLGAAVSGAAQGAAGPGGGLVINGLRIVAGSRQGGRAAAGGLTSELERLNVPDTGSI